jgi:putative ABC transport system ATP-binding protein
MAAPSSPTWTTGRLRLRPSLVWSMALGSLRLRLARSLLTLLTIAVATAFLVYLLLLPAGGTTAEINNARLTLALALLVSAAGVLNTLLMAVTQRYREIGTLKCLGALDSFVLLSVLLEAMLLGLAGALAGVLLGGLIALGLGALRFGSEVWTQVPWASLPRQSLLAIGVGLGLAFLGAAIPAFIAARMAPMEAMRGEKQTARAPPSMATTTTTDLTVMARGLTRLYTLGDETVTALGGVDLDISAGEYVSIMGPSGSGKTTLFNAIGGLDKPTSGSVFIDEIDIAQLDANELAWLRCRKIGYIFQSYNIVKVMTALENVTLPMLFAGVPPDAAQDRAVEILRRVGLGDRLLHTPKELSGGQQQRVAIARAFANRPAIILADEPTANLDLRTGEEIVALMREMNQEHSVTVVCATHDAKMLAISDRIVWMRDGRIDRIARREDVHIEQARLQEH